MIFLLFSKSGSELSGIHLPLGERGLKHP